ncbi:MAG: Zn-dependent hydrolase [Chloroflexaceae bacterium]|nr:Zn-dependent hydrolase [Chloroflexaceae bacterium]NJO05083.1 Zn-dependent hydrolase [Chloroflexaceae bacterium]
MSAEIMRALQPDQQRLLQAINDLANIVEPDTPGWTRRFPSGAYLRGREWLRTRMQNAGLSTRIDAAGNLLAERAGSADLPPILIGSHTDTVLGGGRYDGILGVLGAIEVAQCLDEAGVTLRHPLIVADFLAEEANDYGISCVGSRALAGNFKPEWLDRTLNGLTLADAIRAVGGTPEALGTPLASKGAVAACLELHIEQGPVLDQRGKLLAAVNGIVGIQRGTLVLQGQPDHAGTTPMELRRDALATAAVIISTLEALCRDEPQAVGTVGRLEVSPNQSNVIPGTVTLTAEIRSLDAEILEHTWQALWEAATAAAQQRGVALELLALTSTPPALAERWLVDLVHQVCRRLDDGAIVLPSGAGHDSSQLAQLAPTAMIFVPSIGGRSHCPEEATTPEHLVLGVAALAHAVVAVDQALDAEGHGQ